MKFKKLILATSLLPSLGLAQAAVTYQPALQSFEALSKTNVSLAETVVTSLVMARR